VSVAHIPHWWLILSAAALIFGAMVLEARVSWAHERLLRARGAIEPRDDVWTVMAAAYPSAFAAMVIESALRGGPSVRRFLEGLAIWAVAKLLKVWAIRSLGTRWSFRVLVLPGAPLVASGPYRWMRHPNYVAIVGEFAGAGTMLAAPTTFLVFTAIFIGIMRRRIDVEERALGLRTG
jgi:methyltransferase